MAISSRLNRFRDIEHIDTIVSRSAGAYTHDEVFSLDAGFAHSLLLMYFEQSAYNIRAEKVKAELRQTNK